MPEKKIILYLEDSEEWRESISESLDEFDIRTAATEKEFKRKLEEDGLQPCLFLIDWLLSEGNASRTSEGLIRDLIENYNNIPRIVLTVGADDAETLKTIAELQCTYVEKGSEKTLREAIRENIGDDESAEHAQPPVKDAGERYDESVDEILKNKKKAEQEVARQQQFFERFVGVGKCAVDESLKLQDFVDELLHWLVEYNNCYAGVYISFRNNEGYLVHREQPIQSNWRGDTVPDISRVTLKHITIAEIGKFSEIKNLAKEVLDTPVDEPVRYTKSRIVENYQAMSIFARVRLTEIACRNHLLLAPVQMNGVAVGAILLFDRRDGRCFDDQDKERINLLPLSDMVSGAEQMPFRMYEQKGGFKSILKVLLWLVYWGSFKQVILKPWEVKSWIISTYMELLWLGIAVISVAVIGFPMYYYFTYSDHSIMQMKILNKIELLLMFLTFILFSLGLVVLFEPVYSRSLPKWMLNFTRISTLEGTLLRLVAIILAIHILGKFLSLPDKVTGSYSVSELIIFSFGISVVIVTVGFFIKYFLHEKDKNDEEDA